MGGTEEGRVQASAGEAVMMSSLLPRAATSYHDHLMPPKQQSTVLRRTYSPQVSAILSVLVRACA